MPNEVEEIKARVDIVDLVSEYIRLKQAGTNWRALCPFHNEKSPSFMVSRDKQIWHCFGCNEGGDIFSFVQKIEGLNFPETLRVLAQKAGVQLVQQDPKITSQRNRLLDICQLTADFWHKVLLDSSQAKIARDYLKQRKVSDEIIDDFKIGYAPDSWDILLKFLIGRGFFENEIFLAGLSVKKDRGQGFYDRFRNRLMFPINDIHGNPVGFTGRTLVADEKTGKYINTPQTLIYNKSLVLYNLDKAKTEIKKQDLAVVVEGQMDVVASVQAGTGNVIASSGTAFTPDQINILKRYTNNLAMAFDMDMAGDAAAKRGIDLALRQEMNIKIIVLPHGKDPDDCIKNNPKDWPEAIEKSKSVMDYYFNQVTEKIDLSLAEGKKQAAKILLGMINKIGNKIEQTHWLQKLGDLLSVSEQILREALNKSKDSVNIKTNPAVVEKNPGIVKSRRSALSEGIIAIGLKFPQFLSYLIDNLKPEMMDDSVGRLYKELIIYYTEHINNLAEDFNYNDFKAKISDSGQSKLADTLILLAEKDFFDLDQEFVKNELTEMINFLKRDYWQNKRKQVEADIRQSEQLGKNDDFEALSAQFNEINNQLNLLD